MRGAEKPIDPEYPQAYAADFPIRRWHVDFNTPLCWLANGLRSPANGRADMRLRWQYKPKVQEKPVLRTKGVIGVDVQQSNRNQQISLRNF
jgi:hypothetical protein